MLGDLESACTGHGAVFFEVGLVADDDDGDVGIVFDTDDLVAELGQLVKTAGGCDGEDEEEALALLHVEFAHCGELFGTGCVEAVILGLVVTMGDMSGWDKHFQDTLPTLNSVSHCIEITSRYQLTSTATCFRYESSIVGS